MSTLYFSYDPDESVKKYSPSFSYSEELDEEHGHGHISEFHRFCRTIAALYGYSQDSIDKYFGKEKENPFLD